MTNSNITRQVLKEITPSTKMPVERQARLLILAIEKYIKQKRSWTLREVRSEYARITGPSIKPNRKHIVEYNLTGDVGEVVMHNGVELFFQNPKVRDHYGYGHISDQMQIMVAAEGYNKKIDFPSYKDRWVMEAKKVFKSVLLGGKGGDSLTDFFFREGVMVDSKAKLRSRITVDGKFDTTSYKRHKIDNKYIVEASKSSAGMLIGFTWVSVRYEKVLEDSEIAEEFRSNLKKYAVKLARQTNAPHLLGNVIDESLDGIWKAVGIEVEGFMPVILKKGKLQAQMNKYIDLVQYNADRDISWKVVELNVKHIEQLIGAKKRKKV